jgi:hypothetical protein
VKRKKLVETRHGRFNFRFDMRAKLSSQSKWRAGMRFPVDHGNSGKSMPDHDEILAILDSCFILTSCGSFSRSGSTIGP